MAGKVNMFSSAVQKRVQEQQQIEAAVTSEPVAGAKGLTAGGKVRKRGNNATTMTLSCSMEDKIKVKEYAASKCMSVSDLLHQWIVEYCN